MRARRGHHFGYAPPGTDSPRAKASAQLFLTGARSLDHVTAEWLARSYHLKPKTAEYLLIIARQRRAG